MQQQVLKGKDKRKYLSGISRWFSRLFSVELGGSPSFVCIGMCQTREEEEEAKQADKFLPGLRTQSGKQASKQATHSRRWERKEEKSLALRFFVPLSCGTRERKEEKSERRKNEAHLLAPLS